MPTTVRAFRFTAAAAMMLLAAGCHKAAPPPAPQAMPVQVRPVAVGNVPTGDTYQATIKSRRSATMQPQVDGTLRRILVTSGAHVAAGQVLMTIDPLKQQATVQQQVGQQQQSQATYNYNKSDAVRQKELYDAGIISKQAYDLSVQNLGTSQSALAAATAGVTTQRQELAYYQIRAPFAGVVGDIPVHVGDYVSPTTVLTTVDGGGGLEAYIYIPAERSGELRVGLPVTLIGPDGTNVATSTISFLSPEVTDTLQSILAKAEITSSTETLRPDELVKARITWSTAPKPTVPVLAITRIGGQAFVFVAKPSGNGYVAREVPVTLGDTVGNEYAVLSGLDPGDKVILSGLQFLVDGAPVRPMGH